MNSTESVRTDTGPFAIVPEWLLDSDVSDRAVRLYAILGRYADRHSNHAWPSRRRLADRMNCSIKTIDRAVAELIRVQALEVQARYDEQGDQTTNLYIVKRAVSGGGDESDATPSDTDGATGSDTNVALNESHLELEPVERDNAPTVRANGSQALVAFYVDYARELGVNPPRRLVGQVAKLVGELLVEGQDPETVAKALRIMLDRRLHPATLPSLIPEARAGPARKVSDLDADFMRITGGGR